MSTELREASDAITERQLAATPDPDEATFDDYRLLFVGMDVKAEDVCEHATDYSAAALMAISDDLGAGRQVSVGTNLQAAWVDGFSVAAMLFMRRMEGR